MMMDRHRRAVVCFAAAILSVIVLGTDAAPISEGPLKILFVCGTGTLSHAVPGLELGEIARQRGHSFHVALFEVFYFLSFFLFFFPVILTFPSPLPI
jgi:hypothetical protein